MGSFLVGISGGSGSGKSCFLRDLKEKLHGCSVTFISLDDYYHPRNQQQEDEKGIKNFDLLSSIDHLALLTDLKKIEAGEEVQRVEYTFNNELKESSQISFKPNKVIVIEGLFIYAIKELFDLFDLKIFIQASDIKKLVRRIKRDQSERNYPLEDVVYRYENHVHPSYKKLIEPYIPSMDIIVNNNTGYKMALDVLGDFLKTKAGS